MWPHSVKLLISPLNSLSIFLVLSRRLASMDCSLVRVINPPGLTKTFAVLTVNALHRRTLVSSWQTGMVGSPLASR